MIGDRIRDAFDALVSAVQDLLAPPTRPVPIPIRVEPRGRRRNGSRHDG